MSSNGDLYRLDEGRLADEYVAGLFGKLKDFLLRKQAGHCQRVDYLPAAVLARLGERLANDPDLLAEGVTCRVLSGETDASRLNPWEVTGSGAVALREDATYGRVKVFCALFPPGIRLAEEDSLNVATFKTDDAESFDINRSLQEHVNALLGGLPDAEAKLLLSVLNTGAVRPRPVLDKLRYVLGVIGQREQSQQALSLETVGAYLYELGLVPDFGLNPETLAMQVERNAACAKILLDGEKDLTANLTRLAQEQGLLDPETHRNLAVYLADKPILKADAWLPPIAHEAGVRDKLSFDVWNFKTSPVDITVTLKPLQDPKTKKLAKGLESKGGSLVNDGKKAIQVSWTVSPANPPELVGLRITVIRTTQDGVEMDVIAPQTLPAKRKSFMVPMADNNLDEDEKCIARIRIQALAKGGTPILNAHDESEEFWVENGQEAEPEPASERGKKLRHLDELAFRSTYASGKKYDTRNRGWDPSRAHVYVLRLSNNDRGDLILNPLLLGVEREILRNPENLGIYEADLINTRGAKLEHFKAVKLAPVVNQTANSFYLARKALFGVIADAEDGNGVVESADLHQHSDLVLSYAKAYLDLMAALVQKVQDAAGAGGINTVLHDYAPLLRIDTVAVKVGSTEAPIEAALLAPTHPLRVLWLHQYETFVRSWTDQMDGKTRKEIETLISADSLDKLVSLNIPNALAWNQQQVFINTDSVDFFWSIFPHANSEDLRTAVNAVLQAVGATRREVLISTVTPKQIADKIERYLCHHPYVAALRINVINPGDGQLLLEAIKQLLERELYRGLNLDLKFFAPKGTRHQWVGSAFDNLMEQRDEDDMIRSKGISDIEANLLQPNANPLFPKLIYAKHGIDELLTDTEGKFESHLTFVIDFFGTTVATRAHAGPQWSSTLHNLLAEYLTEYTPGATTATWSRLIAPNQCPPLASDGVTETLFGAHAHLSHLASCFFDWGKSLDKYATVQLELSDGQGKNHLKMLRQIHTASDWVFTIDRNFGIEYYDDPMQGESGGYLIDYTPEFLDSVSHRLIISTYHRHEVESILRSGFTTLLNTEGGEEREVISNYTLDSVLQVLKSVSGKLALKLINNPSQAQEVIGLALTRLALERDGRLKGRVLIPVDAHIALFHQTPKELENSEITLKRTDLMLVELQGRELHIDFIEVKNRKYTSPQALLDLQSEIQAKNKNTEAHFRANFLGLGKEKRFDAEIKNKELANILLFYFDRARRYGLFEEKMPAGTTQPSSASQEVESFFKGLEAVAAGSCDVSFGYEGFIINGSSDFDHEVKVVHDNRIEIIGRRGVASLLGMVLEEGEAVENADDTCRIGLEAVSEGGGSAPEETLTEAGASGEGKPPLGGNHPPAKEETSKTGQTGVSTDGQGAVPASPDQPQGTVEAVQGETSKLETLSIYLGQDTTTGKAAYWDPYTEVPKKLTNQHVLIVGKSGSGKSETTKSMIWELAVRGIPTIIFDYQGEYAEGDFFDVVQPQVFDVMDGLPINPFELPIDPLTKKRKSPIEMVFSLSDTLNTVFSGSGDIQLGILREAIEECYIQQGIDRNDPASWDKEPPTLEMLAAVIDHWAADRGAQVRNLQVRLQPLFKSGIFKHGKANFGFDDLFKKTTVLKMTSGIKDLMLAASRFMLEKIYTAMLMAGRSRTLRVMVCVDEAHKLCGDETVTSLIKEARKYGLGLILSSQETRDFHPSVFANTGTLISLALEDADATEMAKHLGLVDKAQQKVAKETILNHPNGRALVRSQHFLPYREIQIQSFESRLERQQRARGAVL